MEAEIYKDADARTRRNALEGLEKFITTKIYASVFRVHEKRDAERDKAFTIKLASLAWVRAVENLEVAEVGLFFFRINSENPRGEKVFCENGIVYTKSPARPRPPRAEYGEGVFHKVERL